MKLEFEGKKSQTEHYCLLASIIAFLNVIMSIINRINTKRPTTTEKGAARLIIAGEVGCVPRLSTELSPSSMSIGDASIFADWMLRIARLTWQSWRGENKISSKVNIWPLLRTAKLFYE
jgi:hypothetical protein